VVFASFIVACSPLGDGLHVRVRDEQIYSIGGEKWIESKNSRALVSVRKNMTAGYGEEQASGLVIDRGVKIYAKAALKWLVAVGPIRAD
jgi:hypothetical protein